VVTVPVDGGIDGVREGEAGCIVAEVSIGAAVAVQAAAVNPTKSVNITPWMRIAVDMG
jgi:hypothetical protein